MARISAKNIMADYRKKPVVIQAILWQGEKSFDELFEFADADNNNGIVGMKDGRSDVAEIRTLEGIMSAQVGDYIIKGVKGELYPCKPDIFEATYDAVECATYLKAQALTFGQKLAGLNLNPSGDDRVGQVKQKFAYVADMIGDPAADTERRSWSYNAFRTYALTTLLGAQMAAVKLLTWKD